MFKRIHPFLAAASFALALGILTARPASADVLASGQAGDSPFVVVWVDTDKGSKYDAKASKELRAQFAASHWSITDEGVLITKGEKLLAGGSFVSPEDLSWAQFHGRTGSTVATGLLLRYSDDPSQGFGSLVFTEASQDGKSSRTIYLQTSLQFADGGEGDGA
jgi:hypothetical protein